ncbi:hypothetical protein SLS61_007840 [Didymella pomorum]
MPPHPLLDLLAQTTMQTIENILRFLFPSFPPPVDYNSIVVRRAPPHTYLKNCLYLPVEVDSSFDLDLRGWYADFHSRAYCAPHMSGEGVVVFYPTSPYTGADQRERKDWAVARLCAVYSHLRQRIAKEEGAWNARLVRCLEVFGNERGLVLERLEPGPLKRMTLPGLSVPGDKKMWTAQDKALLALYIRWSLHLLTALRVLHQQDVYAGHFNHHSIFLRGDLSLALTGFLHARINCESEEDIDNDYGEASYEDGEEFDYHQDGPGVGQDPCVKEDLFYWATFVWRCVTNCHADGGPELNAPWVPIVHEEGGMRYDRLEDERLGHILVKVWKCGYETVEQVVRDVKAVAKGLGFEVEDDEVSLGREWGDVFHVFEREDGRKEVVFRE